MKEGAGKKLHIRNEVPRFLQDGEKLGPEPGYGLGSAALLIALANSLFSFPLHIVFLGKFVLYSKGREN